MKVTHARDLLAASLLVGVFWSPLFSSAVAQETSVTTYHGDANRSGHYVAPGLTWDRARHVHVDANFHTQIAGHVYAQPLYWHPSGSAFGLLMVATEDNVVYALNAETGAEVWKRSLGPPAPRAALSCGNIDPLGITGTPAIDPTSQALYLDAVTMGSGSFGPQHLIYGLSLRDGSVLPGWPINVADALRSDGLSFISRDQSERGALLVQGGMVYVPYGGHWGDCGQYHGWVVGVDLRDPKKAHSWSTQARAGGIWAQGGVVSDGQSLFVTTGNTMGARTWGDGEAIIRLSPALATSSQPRDFFAPSDWQRLDGRDADLGGVAPMPLDLRTNAGVSPVILALGKDGKAYVADRTTLGGIGGQLASQLVTDGQIFAAAAVWPTSDGGMVAFHGIGSSCPAAKTGEGVVAIGITAGTPPKIRTVWCASLDGAGAPIVTTSDDHSDPIVWIAGAEGDNRLHGFRGDTGEEIFTGGGPSNAMRGLRHFGTILAANNRLYIAADGRVYAFTY